MKRSITWSPVTGNQAQWSFMLLCVLLLTPVALGNPQTATNEMEMVQVGELRPPGAAENYFGESVSLSGHTAVVGSEHFGHCAHVFARDSKGHWIHQAKLLPCDPSKSRGFGRHVSVSGDIIVVGAVGSVHVFARSVDGVWSCKTVLDLVSGGGVTIDGDTIILTDGYGAVVVYTRDPDGTWIQEAKITPSGIDREKAIFNAVSLYRDTALVAGEAYDVNGRYKVNRYPFVWLFRRYGKADWRQEAQLFCRTDGEQEFRQSPTLHLREGVAVVSYRGFGLGDGDTFVFVRGDGTTWTQQTHLPIEGEVCLSERSLIIGSKWDDSNGANAGSVSIFTQDTEGVWRRQRKLIPDDGGPHRSFGSSVACEGSTLLVGSAGCDIRPGNVYVYRLGNPLQEQSQSSPGSTVSTGFQVGDLTIKGVFPGRITLAAGVENVRTGDGGDLLFSAYAPRERAWIQVTRGAPVERTATDRISALVDGTGTVFGSVEDKRQYRRNDGSLCGYTVRTLDGKKQFVGGLDHRGNFYRLMLVAIDEEGDNLSEAGKELLDTLDVELHTSTKPRKKPTFDAIKLDVNALGISLEYPDTMVQARARLPGITVALEGVRKSFLREEYEPFASVLLFDQTSILQGTTPREILRDSETALYFLQEAARQNIHGAEKAVKDGTLHVHSGRMVYTPQRAQYVFSMDVPPIEQQRIYFLLTEERFLILTFSNLGVQVNSDLADAIVDTVQAKR